VKIDYDVKGFAKGTHTLHFKKVLVEPNTDCGGGGCGSVSCGDTGSLYTSFTDSVECDGIHLALKLERTGKNPAKYERSLVVPWSELDYTAGDSAGTIRVKTTWLAAATPQ